MKEKNFFREKYSVCPQALVKGFTLIELLLVISIIGFLTTAAVIFLKDSRDKAKITRAKAEVKVLFDAINRYYVMNNAWPPVDVSGNIMTTAAFNTTLSPNYVSNITDDPWAKSYFFDGLPTTECALGQSSVCSAGPNGVFESWNRADLTPQADDVCIYFQPEC